MHAAARRRSLGAVLTQAPAAPPTRRAAPPPPWPCPALPCPALPCPAGSIAVSLQLPYRCSFGQTMCVIGARDDLGAWNVQQAVPMEWTEGDVWVVELQLPKAAVEVEYKYVVRSERSKEAVRWKEGGNFQLHLPAQGKLRVRDSWDDSSREVEVGGAGAGAAGGLGVVRCGVVGGPQEGQAVPGSAAQAACLLGSGREWLEPICPPARPASLQPGSQARLLTGCLPAALPACPQVEVLTPAQRVAQRAGRRKKVDEDAETVTVITRAADKAMKQLDAAVSRSFDLLSQSTDPAAPELLAADRQVAAAAKRAATMNKALDATKEVKLLPPAGAKAAGSKQPTRRRRAASKDAPPPQS